MPGKKTEIKSESPLVTMTKVTETSGFVKVSKKVVKNMGDYNSISVEVDVGLPIDFTREHMEAAANAIRVCTEIVDLKLEQEIVAVLDPTQKIPKFIVDFIKEKI